MYFSITIYLYPHPHPPVNNKAAGHFINSINLIGIYVWGVLAYGMLLAVFS